MLHQIEQELMMSFTMAWEILWALILGFALSAVVQAVVSKEEMSRLLPDDKPGTIIKACGLGAASSSCSYAAVALARSMFKKRSELYLSNGLPVRLHQPRSGVGHTLGGVDGLAIHAC